MRTVYTLLKWLLKSGKPKCENLVKATNCATSGDVPLTGSNSLCGKRDREREREDGTLLSVTLSSRPEIQPGCAVAPRLRDRAVQWRANERHRKRATDLFD
jgi:hypothetical protein